MRRVRLISVLLISACFTPWPVIGPYRCNESGSCPDDLLCDDGLCCDPNGLPACRTRVPDAGHCLDGSAPKRWYADTDGDGYGNAAGSILACAQPFLTPYVDNGDDCDDSDPQTRPGGTEACDGLDNNCNGAVDEGLSPRKLVYRDQDNDGAGDPNSGLSICAAALHVTPGYVENNGDCAPTDPTRFPGQVELCNGIDDDCDGRSDEEPVQGTGQLCSTGQPGLCASGTVACVSGMKQCLSTYQPLLDVCDGLDNDCDGQVDERPDCGGPASFLNPPPGVIVGARDLGRALTFGEISGSCLKDFDGGTEAAWINPNWIGPGPNDQLLYIEAAAGATWDLSKPGLAVHMAFHWSITSPASSGTDGPWDEANMPVMSVCGEDDVHFLRYVHVPDSLMKTAGGEADFVVPLAGERSPGFILGSTPTPPDVRHIRRIEFLVKLKPKATTPQPTFVIAVSPDAGITLEEH